jgi:CheY-like chemotaxis protein
LPQLIPAEASYSATRPAWSEEQQGALGGIRVLVADDDEDSREIAARVLRESGAQVKTVSSGQAAIAEWRRRPSDILICDLAMPHVDGFGAQGGKWMRLMANTAAIAVTAHASKNFGSAACRGLKAHLAKPVGAGVRVSRRHSLPRRFSSDLRT